VTTTNIAARAAAALALAVLLRAPVAHAQSYPNRPITLVMPVAAGGPNDTAGRVVAQRLSAILGQSIVIENRAGAGGTIANAAVARAAPDGYTLLFATAGTYVQSAVLYRNLSYDIARDFVPVSQVLVQPLVMSASLATPDNLKDFVAEAKANPGKMNYGSAGHATSGHLTGLLFSKVAGINTVHVPFRAASAVSTALMQNQVQFFFDTAFTAKPHVDAGRLRVLGVAGDRHSNALPDVPTFIEVGYPGFTAQTWAGIVVPAGTPREVVERLHAASKDAVASKDVQVAFARFDTRAVGSAPAEFAALISQEFAKWKALAAEFNITVD
jgi:tripartite-type tricarboxylate transporter receptor subunit TctC